MDVFVYGTLTDPGRARRVVGTDFEYHGPARLDGLHRVDGRYPTLAPGGSVDGRLLRTTAVDALDAYEGVDTGLYVRVEVPLVTDDGDEAVDHAQVYVGDSDRLGVDVEWPGPGSFPERVERYVEREVTVRQVGTDD